MIPKILTEEMISKIKTDAFYKKDIDAVRKEAEKELERPYPDMRFSKLMLFPDIGERREYEDEYFLKRKRLNYFTLMFLLYREEKYKKALEDCIWNICGEITWCLPAHIDYTEPVSRWQDRIDLFAAETGGALAEILSLAGDSISKPLADFARSEIRRRVINSFLAEKNRFFWETTDFNWAAVCAGSVGIAMFYESDKEEIEMALPRILDTMDCYLSGINNDGCCMEGLVYWNYGFGFFTYFADLLKKYTNGEKNLFELEKVHETAKFQFNMHMGETRCVSFSDAISKFMANAGLSGYLSKIYDDISPLPSEWFEIKDERYRWFAFIRNFVWAVRSEADSFKPTEYKLYKDAQWYIRNTAEYSFAAKGGHNEEPHNHNDIGSFIFVSDDKQILADYGAGKYTRQYFHDERYTFLVTSSRGHSVPIIDGEYQKNGKESRGRIISASEKEFTLDISEAYGICGLSAVRKFTVYPNGIGVTDTISMDREFNLTERFFTCIKPLCKDGVITIDGYRLSYDSAELEAEISEETFEGKYNKETAYLIDFKPKTVRDAYKFEFKLFN